MQTDGSGSVSLGPIFWATDAPPADLLGFPTYMNVNVNVTGAVSVRGDIGVFLRSLLSEYVALPLAADESSERSLYRLPGAGPPRLVQLIRHDSATGNTR